MMCELTFGPINDSFQTKVVLFLCLPWKDILELSLRTNNIKATAH